MKSTAPDLAELFERSERAIKEFREILETYRFIIGWVRSRPSANVSRTSLLLDEEEW